MAAREQLKARAKALAAQLWARPAWIGQPQLYTPVPAARDVLVYEDDGVGDEEHPVGWVAAFVRTSEADFARHGAPCGVGATPEEALRALVRALGDALATRVRDDANAVLAAWDAIGDE